MSSAEEAWQLCGTILSNTIRTQPTQVACENQFHVFVQWALLCEL